LASIGTKGFSDVAGAWNTGRTAAAITSAM